MSAIPERASRDARLTLAGFGALALAGLCLGWDQGQLPQREAEFAAVNAVGCKSEANCTTASDATAPDLALYAAIITDVRGGCGYYEAAHERIPHFGFPITSPLNWRLPTYAWILSLLPNQCWIQGVLLLLGIGGLWFTFAAERAASSIGHAAATTLLMFGVFRWVLDGQAYLAQEVWAGVLMVISVAALRLAESSARWRYVAVGAGILALLFRELVLPYCLVAAAVAIWRRRWWEAAGWCLGLAGFAALLVWHVVQVRAQLSADGLAGGGAGLAQWLRFGGLDFVLLTLRMNSLLFAWPAALLWLYLLGSLFGLARRIDDASRVCCLAALAYVLAFAFVGRSENFYWGLIYAPLLPWGLIHGLAAMRETVRQAWPRLHPPMPSAERV